MGHKMNKWVVAQHPREDKVLLAFGNDVDEIPEFGFAILPQDAIEIGGELIKAGRLALEPKVVAEEPQDPNYEAHVNGD